MQVSDHEEVRIEGLRGFYSRGGIDLIPRDHLQTANNVEWEGRVCRTRRGIASLQTMTFASGSERVVRVFRYQRTDGNRIVVLTDARKVYDLSASVPSTPILTIAGSGTLDVAVISLYDRLYISPHDGEKGLTGDFVYVYNGTGTARKAAGVAPTSGTFAAATSATAGNVEAGKHIIAVVYETDSGFVTKPGPATYLVYTAPGAFKIDLTNIPTGPSGTSKRKILASKIIFDPTVNAANQEDYELFFVPDGVLNDNTTTTLTIDFFDSNLKDSADYLLDELTEIPAVVAFATYGTSMCAAGEYANPSLVRVSKASEPESFSEIDGFVLCAPADGGGVHNIREFRQSLYMFKSSRSYITQATGVTPADWPVDLVDGGFGCEAHGIAEVLDSTGSNQEMLILVDRSGLRPFNGSFAGQPLTYKIEDFWATLASNDMKSYEVSIDPIHKQIYVLIADDSGNIKRRILMGDYSEGLSPDKIRWSIWNFNGVRPTSIFIKFSKDELRTNLVIAPNNDNTLYYMNGIVGTWTDPSGAIAAQIVTPYVPDNLPGVMFHTAHAGLQGSGSGVALLVATGIAASFSYPEITLSTAGINNMYRKYGNLPNQERVCLSLTMKASGQYFYTDSLFLYQRAMYSTRPQ